MKELPKPSVQLVEEAVRDFNSDVTEDLKLKALTFLFGTFPENVRVEQVVLKAATVNSLYSTNIYGITAVAQHILRADIDGLLKAGFPEAVTQIARAKMKGKERSVYSFATKYCRFHVPDSTHSYGRSARNPEPISIRRVRLTLRQG